MADHKVFVLFRAAVREDHATVDQLTAELAEADWRAVAARIAAVFGLAVHRLFTPDTDAASISRFVAEARAELAEADDIAQGESEILVRAALGEAGLAAHISQEVAVPTQIVLAVKILREASLSDLDLEWFLDEAEALAVRWAE